MTYITDRGLLDFRTFCNISRFRAPTIYGSLWKSKGLHLFSIFSFGRGPKGGGGVVVLLYHLDIIDDNSPDTLKMKIGEFLFVVCIYKRSEKIQSKTNLPFEWTVSNDIQIS